jgi:hypothetical protein
MKYPQLVSMPSAVSDWLEEQLEARGIDAVVYTRYILSLLHSDTVDVIYSDEDLHFSHLKKVIIFLVFIAFGFKSICFSAGSEKVGWRS